jgi:nucleoside-triphosphatase
LPAQSLPPTENAVKAPPRILLEGRPGVGKTTVAERLVALLRDAEVPVSGFLTRELREGRRRVGFSLQTLDGKRALLAHVDLPGPPRVGKYGVDVPSFEELAIPALSSSGNGRVTVIDELGKMELASRAFCDAVSALLERHVAVVATVLAARHPFTDSLKRRRDTETMQVTVRNRDHLPGELAARLSGAP